MVNETLNDITRAMFSDAELLNPKVTDFWIGRHVDDVADLTDEERLALAFVILFGEVAQARKKPQPNRQARRAK